MRPGQNKRLRGRPNTSRRGPNPLTRSYESNGPDVKIRGNAHHVAEKYLQLARDAHTGGDPVAAENYLQHAEHYYRLIASAQAAQAAAQSGRPAGEGELDDMDDDDDIGGPNDRFASPAERAPAPYVPPPGYTPQPPAPQPVVADRPAYDNERQGQGERPSYNDRNAYAARNGGNKQQDRTPRPERNYPDRSEGFRGQRDNRQRDYRPYGENGAPRDSAQPSEGAPAALPSFITAAPRLNGGADGPDAFVEPQVVESQQGTPDAPFESAEPDDRSFQGRGRRRRMRTPFGYNTPPGYNAPDDAPAPEAGPAPAQKDDVPAGD